MRGREYARLYRLAEAYVRGCIASYMKGQRIRERDIEEAIRKVATHLNKLRLARR